MLSAEAEADNTNRDLDYSRYHKTHPIIVYSHGVPCKFVQFYVSPGGLMVKFNLNNFLSDLTERVEK